MSGPRITRENSRYSATRLYAAPATMSISVTSCALPHGRRVILPTRKKKFASTPHVHEVFAPHRSGNLREEASLKRPSRRKVFEALYRTQYLQVNASLPDALERDQNDDYVQSGAQIAWEIWQAAHSHAIELAAQLCELRQQQHVHQDHKAICRICACDIRALQSEAEGDEVG